MMIYLFYIIILVLPIVVSYLTLLMHRKGHNVYWYFGILLVSVINPLLYFMSIEIIEEWVWSICRIEESNGRINYIYPLNRFFIVQRGMQNPLPNLFIIPLVYFLFGYIILFLLNRYVVGIKDNKTCVKLTLIVTLIPIVTTIVVFYIFDFLYYYNIFK